MIHEDGTVCELFSRFTNRLAKVTKAINQVYFVFQEEASAASMWLNQIPQVAVVSKRVNKVRLQSSLALPSRDYIIIGIVFRWGFGVVYRTFV